MEKNSFTLFETILSITLILIIITSFAKSTFYDNFDKTYMDLDLIDNSFTTKSYSSNFSKSNTNIKIIRNDSDELILPVKQIKYEDENLKIIKYEL